MRDFSQVSKTAITHIHYRSQYGIPYAKELAERLQEQGVMKDVSEEMIRKDLMMIMEARYKGGEAALAAYLDMYPNAQVLEVASGFSLHCAVLAGKYPGALFYDTDYSAEFIETKKELIAEVMGKLPENLYYMALNALDLPDLSAAGFTPDRPVIIYNEGLMAYLDDAEKTLLASKVKDYLGQCGGVWITPDPALSTARRNGLAKFSPYFRNGLVKAEQMAGQKYDEHGFVSEQAADDFFKSEGFTIEKRAQPKDLVTADIQSDDTDEKSVLEDIAQNGKVWALFLEQ